MEKINHRNYNNYVLKKYIIILLLINIILLGFNILIITLSILKNKEETSDIKYLDSIEIIESDDYCIPDTYEGPRNYWVFGIKITIKSLLTERTDVQFNTILNFGTSGGYGLSEKKNITLVSVDPISNQKIDLEIWRVSEIDLPRYLTDAYILVKVFINNKIIDLLKHDLIKQYQGD